jgi:hypothetical protein
VTTHGSPQSRTHNAQNQLTSVGSNTLTFDANGNMTTDETGRKFVYDAWNRLVGALDSEDNPILAFTYDAVTCFASVED